MNTVSHPDLISKLSASPERELAGVIAGALEERHLEVVPARRRFAALAAERAENRCCGLSFTSHAKRIICPLCGKAARAS